MAHVRKQIRDAFAAVLTGLSITQSRVFTNRTMVMQSSELPGLLITTNSEQDKAQDIHGLILERLLTVNVIAKCLASSHCDDLLDGIAAEVEVAIQANQTLGGLCKNIQLLALDISIDENQEQIIGELVMQFQVLYYTQSGVPDISI
ncbi:MAG TPA: hypothetical protein DCO68_10185 [Methylophilaceae bacterium]|nr:hypothetical protein [Methylophilaceae bacterium]